MSIEAAPAIFTYFMTGYWNHMSPDLYASFDDALADFKATEGALRFEELRTALSGLHRQGRFPSMARIEDAYGDPVWASGGRILTVEDLTSSKDFR